MNESARHARERIIAAQIRKLERRQAVERARCARTAVSAPRPRRAGVGA